MSRSNGLPDGELPDGRRPRIRDCGERHRAALVRIDELQHGARGGLIHFPNVSGGATILKGLESRGLISIGPRFLVGLTPGGDRALERWDL